MSRTKPGRPEQQSTSTANRPLEFNVVASDDGQSVAYELRPTNAASKPYLHGQTIRLPRGPDWYDIAFHLVDNSSRRLEFDPKEPICAHVGAGCPPQGSGNLSDGQLIQDSLGSKKLVMVNKNQDPPREIAYTLCFVDAATNQPVDPFDPIMDNGGGGRTFF
jgi:hypothetical protein